MSLVGMTWVAWATASIAPSSAQRIDATPDPTLEEVVVTAQKRSEDLQKVPIAISAFSRDDLARYGATSVQDVAKFTPNVQIYDNYAGAQPTWVIRGIGLQDFNPNNTPAASIFVDDVYQTSNVMGGASLFDVDRIEVLKGPQGGLYGRNTIGGAVQVITHHPDFDGYTGDLSVSDGRWGDLKAQAAFGGPLAGDWLAFRLAGTVEHSTGGWQTSLATGEIWDKKSSSALRLELAGKASDDLKVLLNLHTAEDTSELPLARAIGIYGASGGFCPAVLAGQRNDVQCLDLPQVIGASTQSPSVQSLDGSVTLSNPVNKLGNHAYGASLNVQDSAFDTMALTSITSYDEFDYNLNYDFDGTSQIMGQYVQHTPMRSASEDLRLASATATKLDWIVGVDVSYDTLSEHRHFLATDNSALSENLGIPNFADDSYLQYVQETRYWAIYGQGTFHITDTLNLDFGLRDSNETKHYENGFFSLPVLDVFVSKNNNVDYTLHDHVSGKLGLDWQVDPNILAYASMSRGYKSGGFFGGFPLNLAQIQPYKEETVLAYETGLKSESADHRLRVNASLFYYDIRNYQDFTEQFSNFSHTIVNVLSNLGDAVNKGAEIEVAWLPLHGLTLQASGGYLNATITKSSATFTDIQGGQIPYQGSRIPFAPRWSTNEYVRYEHPVLGDYLTGLQLDYNFRSQLTAPRGTIDAAVGTISGYGLMNVRLDLQRPGSGWSVALFGKNITNKRYRLVETSDGVGDYSETYGPPVSFGAVASKKF